MWIVGKIKAKEVNVFKKALIEKINDNIKFYYPVILYKRHFRGKTIHYQKPIIENYIFCFHPKFSDNKIINNLKFLKGLNYFLNGYLFEQKSINHFINHCKTYENNNGYLLPSFFAKIIKKKGQFVSGPFKNFIFEKIERKKNNLKIQIGNIKTSVSINNYLYKPI